jgi:UDP-glucose 4-epimerase
VDVGDPAAVQAAFATGPFDATIHLASRGAAINSMVGAVEDARLTAVVTEQGAAAGRSGHLILFGSADQYGRAPAPQSPATPTDPINAYGLAKDLSDAVAAHARPRVPAPISVLRPFSVYGPGQPPRMFLSQLAVAIEAGTEFRMSAGTQVRDFVHVSDVCQAVVLLLGTPEAAGRTWNVGTGHGISLREAVDLLCDAAGARIPVRIEGAVRADDPPALVADASETRQRLGWRPAIDLVSGFRGMLGGSGAGDAP